MTDVNKIISDYKEACRRKELERQAELQKIQQQRALNAEVIEKCIKAIIEPAFDHVKSEILQNGFPCDVELISKKDPSFSGTKTFAIGIKIITKNKTDNLSGNKSHLLYEGSFDAQEISKSEWIALGATPSEKHPPIAVSRVDSDMVDEDLEQFLLKVFRV